MRSANEMLLKEAYVVPGSALATAQKEETSNCSQRKHPRVAVPHH